MQVGVLGLLVRRGAAARTEDCRQTDDEGACQVRLQESTLLLPITARANFWAA